MDLAGDWSQSVLTATVLPGAVQGAVPQRQPVVVFVAGQPGSGKSLVADLVHAALGQRGGAVRVDHDEYKAVHPHYRTFLEEDVRTAGVRVRPQTYWWQAEVEAQARALRCDVVVETPLADPEVFRGSAAAYRQAGYRIEVVALAVPEAVSQLGVLDRYLRLAVAGRARYVSWENHDRCAAGLVASLEACEAERLADRVVVVGRNAAVGPALYDSGAVSSEHGPAGAGQAVVAERARPWSAVETGLFRRRLAEADRRAHRTAPGGHVPEDWGLAVQRDAERAAALAEPVRRVAQPRRELPGVDYHRLSAEEHRWIYDELIAPSLCFESRERPVAVYVMGQPGAGKTRAARLVRQALTGRALRISAARFMEAHPDYRQLLRTEPYTAELRIRGDYRAWQARAEADVRARRGNVVIETAPDTVGEFLAGAALYRQAGYRVELAVLAVRAADSRQAGLARYAEVSRHGSRPAPLVRADRHDDCLAVLGQVVAAAEESGAVDSVVVMRADGHAVHRGERVGGLLPYGAAQALADEQLRPYGAEEASRFFAVQRRLRSVLPQHRDELGAISRLAAPLMPVHLRPHSLAQGAVPAALPLPVRSGPGGCQGPADSSSSSRAS
ncbi:zeta toxin family protein [Streptomyces sp. AP-93]|uniref:zeta toxin family protein n=1 Tax=Streptomyces sp. AP-93 TaxID=2929048 RepID=UPI001FAF669E|nr:zeta toxin family protein [Streptomyces sp. AP-93]MCJ0875253.1 zeta toxin family protein [Streptomyces sp. AP-93]